MASKTFLLLALAFAVVVITSQTVAAKEVASNHDSEVDGRSGYNGHHGSDHINGRGGYNRAGPEGHGKGGGGRRHGGCKYGCCGRGHYNRGGCKCCSTFAEATAYKETNI
ncbi:hypothetical protein R6Q59_033487 [Mikania micrantha]